MKVLAERKHIALVAHDNEKPELLDYEYFNEYSVIFSCEHDRLVEKCIFVNRIGEQNSLEYFLYSECSVRLFKQRELFVLECKEYFRHCFCESEDDDELVKQCLHAFKQCF